MDELKTYYVSLVGPFYGLGLCVRAVDEGVVREWANRELGNLWCSVYGEPLGFGVVGNQVVIGPRGDVNYYG